jgi:hypothetical protein
MRSKQGLELWWKRGHLRPVVHSGDELAIVVSRGRERRRGFEPRADLGIACGFQLAGGIVGRCERPLVVPPANARQAGARA